LRIGDDVTAFYRWRPQYGGMNVNDAKQLRELEKAASDTKNEISLEMRLTRISDMMSEWN
jgi:hypothetical protein